ncbi:phosphatidate cytidylyltransferase [Marinimicrobium alkaliphilum]|uniref:phosphatidate cytidylyltransferase n=1 Tax=Marinimicrobium alkaliphilum TaxID=2202654 RepID=UPI000DB943BA|nr:phosphatidate cytidylyltransferase [Marinimicrobium alkaliphilum]
MTPMEKFVWLIGGIVALLTLASLIGFVLKRRVRSENGLETVLNLQQRVNAWWVMIGIFSIAFLLGPTTTIVLFALMSYLALREFLTLTPTSPNDHRALFVAFFVIIPVQFWSIYDAWYGFFTIFIPVYAFLLLPSLSALAQNTDQFLERTAKIQWGVMVVVYCVSHVPALLILDIPGFTGQNALLLLYLLLVVQISDVLQYVCGKLWGKHKIAPVVSPSKTVEGLVFGGALAVGVGTAMWWITPFAPAYAAAISLVIVIMGFLGGLVMSAVKRSLGAKDWGSMISGHGGMMDRLDSVCFAAPVFFHLVHYFYVP